MELIPLLICSPQSRPVAELSGFSCPVFCWGSSCTMTAHTRCLITSSSTSSAAVTSASSASARASTLKQLCLCRGGSMLFLTRLECDQLKGHEEVWRQAVNILHHTKGALVGIWSLTFDTSSVLVFRFLGF